MMLTDLADVLRSAGLKVVEVDGWKTRGHGAMTNVHGHTIHHNAGGRTKNPKAGLRTIVEGRDDLPGPLAQTYVDIEGTWYVVAAGVAYHAGASLKEDYSNWHRIGTEAQAAGDGWSEDWPEVQMVSLAVGSKALAKHYGYGYDDILGHKETCAPVGRKVDPSFSMNSFRARVKAAPNNLEEHMDLTKANLDDIAQAVWSQDRKLTARDARAYGGDSKEGDPTSPSVILRYAPLVAETQRDLADVRALVEATRKEQTAQTAALTAALQALLTAVQTGSSLTPAQVTAAAQAGAAAALEAQSQKMLDEMSKRLEA